MIILILIFSFALVEVGSETSQRLCTERLPNQYVY